MMSCHSGDNLRALITFQQQELWIHVTRMALSSSQDGYIEFST